MSGAVTSVAVAALVSGVVSWYINKNEVSVKYVEIASGILSSKSTSDKALREWAIEVINENAPSKLKITGDLKTRLVNGETVFGSGSIIEDNDTVSGTGTVK